ncbi:MAG TPA: retroviral-like aspartic protease family protein [Urbifossiella sp.]
MEISTIGKVLVAAKVENLNDLFEAGNGHRQPEGVRRIEVTDALVDTGATMLLMPKRYIQQLGLKQFRKRSARTASGKFEFGVYGMVQLTVQGREARIEVGELGDDLPVVIGQIPLEILDFVVDPQGQRLLGNPDHGGEQMIDLFAVTRLADV